MKERAIAFLFAICLLLAACGKIPSQTTPTAENTQPTATQPNFGTTNADDLKSMPGFDAQNKYLLTTVLGLQETDGFFCGSNMGGKHLQYFDKASGISGALCADPACTHDTIDCGSYIESAASLCYYDGKLYWIGKDLDSGNDFILWRSDLSGMNREKVVRLSYQDVIMKYQPQRFVIHRGNLYLMGYASSVVGASVGLRITLLSTPLDGSGDLTLLYDESFENGVESTMRFVGNYVYFSVNVFKGKSYDCTITRFNTRTGDCEILYSVTEMTEVPGPIWVNDQGAVYLPTADSGHAYVWRLENGERVAVATWEGENLPTPTLADGIAMIFGMEDGSRSISIKSLDDTTIYEGLLYPNGIPGVDGNPNEYFYGIVGGDTDKIIFIIQSTMDTTVNYTIMLALNDNLKPTILWSNQG